MIEMPRIMPHGVVNEEKVLVDLPIQFWFESQESPACSIDEEETFIE